MSIKDLFNIKRQINKPEYFKNPGQIFKRLQYKNQGRDKVKTLVPPIDRDFFVNENEVVGRAILTMGVYDLVVAECLKRCLKTGNNYYDVGANIGYFSRLAQSYGAKVQAFEPHPKILKRLEENLSGLEQIQTNGIALSDQEGEFSLYVPKNFEKNEGVASLEPMPDSVEVKVQTKCLDQICFDQIHLMKIDVEGHEASVLRGAKQKLAKKQIDFIVFEEFGGPQAETIQIFAQLGYKVCRLKKTLSGLKLLNLKHDKNIPQWEPPNYIAFHNQEMLDQAFSESGWQFYK